MVENVAVFSQPCSADMTSQTLITGFRANLCSFVWLFLIVGALSVLTEDKQNIVNLESEPAKFQTFGMVVNQSLSDKADGLERGRNRWAALSLPDNTSCKISLDLSTGINPLNNTFTSLTLSVPFRFVLPTYKSLNDQYGRLHQLENDLSGSDRHTQSIIDYHFLEEQRANDQRRTIYQHIETLFKK